MFLDLTGPGNLLGLLYWEILSPWRGAAWMLNTGVSPREERECSLWQILQDSPPRKYYLSRKACLGILRRAKKRDKELPLTLERALKLQAGIACPPTTTEIPKPYHINQRDEGIDLADVSGVVSKGDGNCFLTGDVHTSLSAGGGQAGQGYPCVLTTAFAANQRDEVRDLHGIAGAISAQPGMKQQTFVAAAFSAGAGAKAGGISYSEQCAPTLRGTASGNMMPSVLCLNDQGGEVMSCSENISGTLRAQERGHQPLVMATQQGGAEIRQGVCPTITAAAGMSGNNRPSVMLYDNHSQDSRYRGPLSVAPTVSAAYGEGGNNIPLVKEREPTLFENHGIDSRYTGPHDVSPTLSARAGTGGNNLPLVAEGEPPAYCITGNAIDRQPQNGGNGIGYQENLAYTLTATDRHAVFSRQRVDVFKEGKVVSTESARQHKDATDLVYQEMAAPLLIRRLTPLECERLQGFPDGWTDIPGASDSARYKALGNSVAIPCVEYIMRGIAYALKAG